MEVVNPADKAATLANNVAPIRPLNTAVLFLVFNRPEVTTQVFEAIRRAKPPRLYVAADGPRTNRAGEALRCEQTRAIATRVDWPCEVKSLFRSENLGCKRAVSAAITWFFSAEEEGIILEDDCLPTPSFFWFCEELLREYRNDTRVWQISGTRFIPTSAPDSGGQSYFFSKYGPIWGWASWRRAWKNYDPDIKQWPLMKEKSWLTSVYEDKRERKARLALGDKLYANKIDTWDYQWGFTKNYESGLSIVPVSNQILNIGFGTEATHTIFKNPLAPISTSEIQQPLRHPAFVVADKRHDRLYRQTMVIGSPIGQVKKIIERIRKRVKFGI